VPYRARYIFFERSDRAPKKYDASGPRPVTARTTAMLSVSKLFTWFTTVLTRNGDNNSICRDHKPP
jgi:hypothetical protein